MNWALNPQEPLASTHAKRKVSGYLDETDAENFKRFKEVNRIKPDTQALEILMRIGIKHQGDYSI